MTRVNNNDASIESSYCIKFDYSQNEGIVWKIGMWAILCTGSASTDLTRPNPKPLSLVNNWQDGSHPKYVGRVGPRTIFGPTAPSPFGSYLHSNFIMCFVYLNSPSLFPPIIWE